MASLTLTWQTTMVLNTAAQEKHFGLILKEHLSAYRDELIISSKAGYDMRKGPYGNWGSRKYLIASLIRALREWDSTMWIFSIITEWT